MRRSLCMFTEELSRLTKAGLRRSLRLVEGPQGPRATIDGKEAILLCSNDYLGLANHPLVKQAAIEAIDAWGVGAGASRLISGNMTAHARLEESIRRFKGTEAALIFNSGYHANVGCITAICSRDSEVFSDRLNHASIVDACLLSRAAFRRYPHRDVDSLERLLKKSRAKRKLVATDGIFSMDGDIAPIREIAGLLDRYDAMLLIDDAHSTGVLGDRGRGTLEHLGVSHPSIIQMGTLGKAVGAFGAFIAGSVELIDILKSKSRPFIYTTALPPSICAASIKALEIIEQEPGLRMRLWENTAFFREGLLKASLDTLGSQTQIIPIAVGQAQRAMELSSRLLEKGVFIQGIRPPTVPEGTSRLRVSVTAAHSREDLTSALSAIREVFQ
ncbi:MAG: 8-amino-7-oxononanoate synthase [Deltaproteobacteria bacterium]|nr:8-amino-7-oxononanoate synthase [Deltaproteobacteria bacterium]